MNEYRRALLVFMAVLVVTQGALVYLMDLGRPLYGDEAHFLDTIHLFGKGLTLHTLKHYPEMITPLSFILYSLWGRVFGFELFILRILSLLIAVATYLLMHRLLFVIFKDSKIAVLTTLFIMLNPYMIGLNCFIYTDMIGILCIVAACLAIYRSNASVFAVSAAAAVWCRQYLIFLTAAALAYHFLRFCVDRQKVWIKMTASGIVSLIPLIFLVFLWKGLGPDNEIRRINLEAGFAFHPSFLTLYICQIFLYLSPIVVVCWQPFYRNIKTLLICFLISPLYWLFPVRPSQVLMDGNIYTVGLFHRTLRRIFDNTFYEDGVFYVLFYLGLVILYYFIRDGIARWKERRLDFLFFLYLSVSMFFLVQPFSYVSWEKYFMPIMPLASMLVLSFRFPVDNRTRIPHGDRQGSAKPDISKERI